MMWVTKDHPDTVIYFGAAVDPSGTSIWRAGEYGNNVLPNKWSNFIGNW
jgi:hypothetical protein